MIQSKYDISIDQTDQIMKISFKNIGDYKKKEIKFQHSTFIVDTSFDYNLHGYTSNRRRAEKN